MANTVIDRTSLNAIVEDDGSGNTGDILTKTQANTVFFAPIDAAIANASGFGFGGPIRERNRSVALGEWTTPTFANTNFVGLGAMTWDVGSGDVVQFRYEVTGKRMTLLMQLDTTTVGGTPNTQLRIAVPGGFTLVGVGPTRVSLLLDNGAEIAAEVRGISGNTTHFAIQKVSGANFSASTNLTYVYATVVLALA